jgi:hypothetical protein
MWNRDNIEGFDAGEVVGIDRVDGSPLAIAIAAITASRRRAGLASSASPHRGVGGR